MKLAAEVGFWQDGVGCFCHEALSRALQKAFGEVHIEDQDLALEKYRSVERRLLEHDKKASTTECIKRSAWFEFLRNGPQHKFRLASGVSGVFGRYSIEFEIPEERQDEVAKVRQFLANLSLGQITVVERDL